MLAQNGTSVCDASLVTRLEITLGLREIECVAVDATSRTF